MYNEMLVYLTDDPKEAYSDPFNEIHASQTTRNHRQKTQIP